MALIYESEVTLNVGFYTIIQISGWNNKIHNRYIRKQERCYSQMLLELTKDEFQQGEMWSQKEVVGYMRQRGGNITHADNF